MLQLEANTDKYLSNTAARLANSNSRTEYLRKLLETVLPEGFERIEPESNLVVYIDRKDRTEMANRPIEEARTYIELPQELKSKRVESQRWSHLRGMWGKRSVLADDYSQ